MSTNSQRTMDQLVDELSTEAPAPAPAPAPKNQPVLTPTDMTEVKNMAAARFAELMARSATERPPVVVEQGKLVPRDLDQLFRTAKFIWASGLAPSTFKSVEQVAVAVAMGMAVGIDPLSAVRCIAVVNNRPALWGDAVPALVLQSGTLTSYRVEYLGTTGAEDRACVVTASRKGIEGVFTGRFSIQDAKRAGLAGRDTWRGYPDRMLLNRARAFCFRDGWADVLNGLGIAEELLDMTDDAPAAPTVTGQGIVDKLRETGAV